MSKKTKIINSPYFDLSVRVDERSADMAMRLKTPFFTTKDIPHTHEMLSTYLPEVLCTKCYNHENLPFEQKVRDTNLAHLFEHILLAYLVEEKKEVGTVNATYGGVTKWDWREGKDPKGTYRIKVTVTPDDQMILENALQRAVELVERLLRGLTPAPAPLPVTAR